jgi:hypothetical protein
MANNDIVERRWISYCAFTKKIYCSTAILLALFLLILYSYIVLEVNITMYNCNVSIALIGGWYSDCMYLNIRHFLKIDLLNNLQ